MANSKDSALSWMAQSQRLDAVLDGAESGKAVRVKLILLLNVCYNHYFTEFKHIALREEIVIIGLQKNDKTHNTGINLEGHQHITVKAETICETVSVSDDELRTYVETNFCKNCLFKMSKFL